MTWSALTQLVMRHADEIQELIQSYDDLDNKNLATYFDGSYSVADKLQDVHFGVQSMAGILYGCIQVKLSELFTEDEEAEFLDWLENKCAEDYGEGLEQRYIHTEEGNLYISFWNGGSDYFLLREDAFEIYINGDAKGEVE